MKGEDILNACKSYGLNGLHTNCSLQLESSNFTLTKKRKLKENNRDVNEKNIDESGGQSLCKKSRPKILKFQDYEEKISGYKKMNYEKKTSVKLK